MLALRDDGTGGPVGEDAVVEAAAAEAAAEAEEGAELSV
jgi:hypothetical protein